MMVSSYHREMHWFSKLVEAVDKDVDEVKKVLNSAPQYGVNISRVPKDIQDEINLYLEEHNV